MKDTSDRKVFWTLCALAICFGAFVLPRMTNAQCFEVQAAPPAEQVTHRTVFEDGVAHPLAVTPGTYSLETDFGYDLSAPHTYEIASVNATATGPKALILDLVPPLPAPSAPVVNQVTCP